MRDKRGGARNEQGARTHISAEQGALHISAQRATHRVVGAVSGKRRLDARQRRAQPVRARLVGLALRHAGRREKEWWKERAHARARARPGRQAHLRRSAQRVVQRAVGKEAVQGRDVVHAVVALEQLRSRRRAGEESGGAGEPRGGAEAAGTHACGCETAGARRTSWCSSSAARWYFFCSKKSATAASFSSRPPPPPNSDKLGGREAYGVEADAGDAIALGGPDDMQTGERLDQTNRREPSTLHTTRKKTPTRRARRRRRREPAAARRAVQLHT